MKNQDYRSLLISSASRRTSKCFQIFNSWPNILLSLLILQLIWWYGSLNWSKQLVHKSNRSSFKVQYNGLLSKSQAAIATRLSINNIKKKSFTHSYHMTFEASEYSTRIIWTTFWCFCFLYMKSLVLIYCKYINTQYIFQNIHKRKTYWKNKRMSKWWQDDWVNYLFKNAIEIWGHKIWHGNPFI